MGATIRKNEVPASQFCVAKNGCEEKPVTRLKEALTDRILDLCDTHSSALLRYTPHSYTKIDLPEGNPTQ